MSQSNLTLGLAAVRQNFKVLGICPLCENGESGESIATGASILPATSHIVRGITIAMTAALTEHTGDDCTDTPSHPHTGGEVAVGVCDPQPATDTAEVQSPDCRGSLLRVYQSTQR